MVEGGYMMTRSIRFLSILILVGLFTVSPALAMSAYAFDNSHNQAQLTIPASYQTVAWHRYHHWHHGYPYGYYGYYGGYYDPYYYGSPYPYGYYGPGFGIYIR